jgi:hypothetical protein
MSHVSSASYPLSKPLATLIQAGVVYSPPEPQQQQQQQSLSSYPPHREQEQEQEEAHAETNTVLPCPRPLYLQVESQTDALQHFVRNCFVAIDNLLFAT